MKYVTRPGTTVLTIVVLIGLSMTATGGAARAGASITACQQIANPGHYSVATVLEGAPVAVSVPPNLFDAYTGSHSIQRTCIEVVVSDVTVDCQGHALVGSGDPSDQTAGIYIAGTPEAPLTDIRVKDCGITAHTFGVYASQLDGGRIEGNDVVRNAATGMYVTDVHGTRLAGNVVERNDPDGILLIGSHDVVVSDTFAIYNRMRGITFEGCQDCVARDNHSSSHGVLGFGIYGSRGMTLQDNVATNNRYHGFATLHEAGDATFRDNESFSNDGVGFYFEGSHGNRMVDNDSHDNGLDGIAVFTGSDPNTFVDNTLHDNGGFGAFSDDPIDPATFARNTFFGNQLGPTGHADRSTIDWCSYTGGDQQGWCDPVFTGGPNLKDPENLP